MLDALEGGPPMDEFDDRDRESEVRRESKIEEIRREGEMQIM